VPFVRTGTLPGASGEPPETVRDNPRIILFDGTCNLCSWTLRFVSRNDTKSLYRYAWVQSPQGKEILEWCGLPLDQFDTMVTIEHGRAYFKSTAFLQAVRCLRFPWPLLRIGMLVPVSFRDTLYDLLARKRYRLFGKQAVCRVPDESLKKRFLGQKEALIAGGFFLFSCSGVSYI
jgi:predicted DCC family thiol-disulfide oxidoreductase YuxK